MLTTDVPSVHDDESCQASDRRELLGRARDCRRVAAASGSAEVARELRKLATRYEALANQLRAH